MEKLEFRLLVEEEILEAQIPEGYYNIFGNLFQGYQINANLNGENFRGIGKFRDIHTALDKANKHYAEFKKRKNNE